MANNRFCHVLPVCFIRFHEPQSWENQLAGSPTRSPAKHLLKSVALQRIILVWWSEMSYMINYVSYDDSYTIHESLKLRIYRSLFHKVILFTTLPSVSTISYPDSASPLEGSSSESDFISSSCKPRRRETNVVSINVSIGIPSPHSFVKL